MALSEEQMKFGEPQMAMIGYMLANYRRFGDDALKVASDYFYELGKSMGQSVKQKMGITKSDAKAVAAVMNAVVEQAAGIKGAMRVEGNKVIGENVGFCPMMEAVRIMKAHGRSCAGTIHGDGLRDLRQASTQTSRWRFQNLEIGAKTAASRS